MAEENCSSNTSERSINSVSSVQPQTSAPKDSNSQDAQSQSEKSTVGTSFRRQEVNDDQQPSTSWAGYSTQTTVSQTTQTPADQTPKKRKLKQFLKNSEKKRKDEEDNQNLPQDSAISRDQFLQGCETYLNPQMSAIVKAQVNLKQRARRDRYTLDFKLFSLYLYQASPSAYMFLSKTLQLPSKSTLSKMYIPMRTKINQQVLDVLAATVRHKSEIQRECVLCMDVMSLKPSLFYDTLQDRIVGLHEINGRQEAYPARYAFTIMLRGITSKWEQPIGFSFIFTRKINNDLEDWLLTAIEQLLGIGYKIRGIISNPKSNFVQFAKKHEISKEKSFFHVNGNKLYYIYDVPNIIKCIRNNLMKYNFEFYDKICSWYDIEALYELDQKKGMKLLPRLTEAHVKPNIFQKQKVRLVTQIFSNSVVAALETYTKSEEIEPCDGTIEFIQLFNDVFDLLNSDNLITVKPYKKPYRADDIQIKLLNEVRDTLTNLKMIDRNTGEEVKGVDKFKDPLIITINSIIQLFDDLKNENVEYLMTRRLNNDALYNFFEIIRQAGGNREATCMQFTKAFRKSFLFKIIKLSEHTNRVEDFDTILFNYNDFCNTQSLYVTNSDRKKEYEKSELTNFDIAEQNKLVYECGSLFQRILEKHSCPSIKQYASSLEDTLCSIEYFKYKTHKKCYPLDGLPELPPNDFFNYCQELDFVFREEFTSFVGDNIGFRIKSSLEQVDFLLAPCDCFPKNYFLKLFVRMRINHYLKFHNRGLRPRRTDVK